MVNRYTSPNIYTPENLTDLLHYYKNNINSLIYSGGTYILKTNMLKDYSQIIDISKIDEINKINRTESYIEIGSGVSINKIIQKMKHILDINLLKCLKNIGNYSLRNLATVGGNLCALKHRMDLYPILLLMDVKIELRKHGSSRWLQLNRLIGPKNTLLIDQGEILTRIRIPIENWDSEAFIQSGEIFTEEYFSFCALSRIQKEVLTDLRFCLCLKNKNLIRNRETETSLIGRKLPLNMNDILNAYQILLESIYKQEIDVTEFDLTRIKKVFYWFIEKLNID